MKYCMFLISLLASGFILGMEQGIPVTNACKQQIKIHCGSQNWGEPVKLLEVVSIEPGNQKDISFLTGCIKVEIGDLISVPYGLESFDLSFTIRQEDKRKVVFENDRSCYELSLETKTYNK